MNLKGWLYCTPIRGTRIPITVPAPVGCEITGGARAPQRGLRLQQFASSIEMAIQSQLGQASSDSAMFEKSMLPRLCCNHRPPRASALPELWEGAGRGMRILIADPQNGRTPVRVAGGPRERARLERLGHARRKSGHGEGARTRRALTGTDARCNHGLNPQADQQPENTRRSSCGK